MAQARYILRLSDGTLYPWYEPWLKIDGMIEYDPKMHGIRSEVAAQMGLVAPEATVAPAKPASKKVTKPEQAAGQVAPATPAATEPAAAQAQPPDGPDLSDVFSKK